MQRFGLISCETAAQCHSRNIQQSVPLTLTYKRDPNSRKYTLYSPLRVRHIAAGKLYNKGFNLNL